MRSSPTASAVAPRNSEQTQGSKRQPTPGIRSCVTIGVAAAADHHTAAPSTTVPLPGLVAGGGFAAYSETVSPPIGGGHPEDRMHRTRDRTTAAPATAAPAHAGSTARLITDTSPI